jgi:uncharacterized protein YdhG (YjbR/CyaY superfamily)
MHTVDDYLAGLEEPERRALARVLALALEEVPEAEQGTSYGIPALRYRGKPLIGFQVAAMHLAVYPFSAAAVDAVRDHVPADRLSKGTVRFTVDAPLPEQAIRRLVQARRDEISGPSR